MAKNINSKYFFNCELCLFYLFRKGSQVTATHVVTTHRHLQLFACTQRISIAQNKGVHCHWLKLKISMMLREAYTREMEHQNTSANQWRYRVHSLLLSSLHPPGVPHLLVYFTKEQNNIQEKQLQCASYFPLKKLPNISYIPI